MKPVRRVQSWNRVSQDQQEGQSSFISPSRHKMAPYLTIYFNRTENINSFGVSPWEPPSTTATISAVFFTSTCSYYASYVNVPLDSSVPSVFTGDGNDKYLGISYGGGVQITSTYVNSFFTSFSATIVAGTPCWSLFSKYMSFYDSCYVPGSGNNRFNVNLKNFTIEVDVYFRFDVFADVGRSILFAAYNSSYQVGRNYNKTALAGFSTTDGTTFISSSYTLTTSQWHSIAFCRNGNTFKLLVGGDVVGSTEFSGSLLNTGYGAAIGGNPNGGILGVYSSFGYFSNFRMKFRQSLY